MKIAAVTCTGNRPELLRLCERWINRQTVPADMWIVSYDAGDKPDVWGATFTQPGPVPPRWTKLPHIAKQNWNLHHALHQVPDDYAAVVFEDDDWYSAKHIEENVAGFEHTGIVCQPTLFGFSLPHRTFNIHNKLWPAEGLVGLRPDAVQRYAKLLPQARDWKMHEKGCMIRPMTSVQIKGAGRGLPGRQGTTAWQKKGRMPGLQTYPDKDLHLFRRMLGDDAQAYIDLL